MTEINRDRLDGQTVDEKDLAGYENQISDLADYVKDRRGLPNPDVVIDVETISPYTTILERADSGTDDFIFDNKLVDTADLKTNDSGLAKHLWENRPQNKKKTA